MLVDTVGGAAPCLRTSAKGPPSAKCDFDVVDVVPDSSRRRAYSVPQSKVKNMGQSLDAGCWSR